ncbi:MAG: glycosyl transferase group 1 [Acidimicrobiaceae bacterium]|nr:glycosyl transferase group 1 [Acidimicrobiaceae bacterium]
MSWRGPADREHDAVRARRAVDDPLGEGVVIVVEQLRRAVPGGIGTYARGLVGGLARMAGSAPPRALLASRPRRLPDPLDRLEVPVRSSVLPGPLLTRAWSAGIAGVGAGPALVHATSMAVPPSRAPLVVTVHDLAWRALPEAYPPRGRRWHEAALARAVGRGSAFVVPSEPVAEALRSAGVTQPVAVIAEGADHLPPPDLEAAARYLAALGVEGPFLVAVGTLEPRKNLARLVAAYSRIRARLPERWPLLLVGPAGWGDAVGSLPEGVVLGGRPGDAVLAGCYALARCCAYVPLLEGFGLPVVEAMAAGTPVVASKVPSAGDAALFVEPTDEESIAEGLWSAASDEAIRTRLVATGRAHVAPMTWEATARAHVALWQEVAASRSGGSGT